MTQESCSLLTQLIGFTHCGFYIFENSEAGLLSVLTFIIRTQLRIANRLLNTSITTRTTIRPLGGMRSTLSIVGALATCVSAHISMQQPVPYNIITGGGGGTGSPPDTSPLQASGADYPCKIPAGGSLGGSPSNTAAVGSTIQMSFKGSAVHNGGSCQVALTKDTPASLSANSQFKVIYSILGGCPGTSGSTVSYDVPIPEDVPAGDYVYAWTWFNVIGNREMYMNCAPITITGGSGSDTTFNALPDMAVYNVGSKNTCKTVEPFDVDFPNPGKYTMQGSSFKPQAPTCDGTSGGTGAGGPGSGSSGGAGGAPNGGTGTGGTPTTSANNGQYTGIGAGSGNQGGAGGGSGGTPTTTANNGLYTGEGSNSGNQGGGSATQSANNGQYTGIGAGAGGSTPQVKIPSSASPITSAPSSSLAQTPTGISTPGRPSTNGTFTPPQPAAGSGPAAGAACTTDSAIVCSDDGSQFALCNHGSAIMMPVAAGTRCTNGAIQKKRRDVTVKLPFPFKG